MTIDDEIVKVSNLIGKASCYAIDYNHLMFPVALFTDIFVNDDESDNNIYIDYENYNIMFPINLKQFANNNAMQSQQRTLNGDDDTMLLRISEILAYVYMHYVIYYSTSCKEFNEISAMLSTPDAKQPDCIKPMPVDMTNECDSLHPLNTNIKDCQDYYLAQYNSDILYGMREVNSFKNENIMNALNRIQNVHCDSELYFKSSWYPFLTCAIAPFNFIQIIQRINHDGSDFFSKQVNVMMGTLNENYNKNDNRVILFHDVIKRL